MLRSEDIKLDQKHVDAARVLLSAIPELRMDANETAHFARQLEYVKARTYDVEYGKLLAAQFIPFDTSMPPGTESITYRQWDEVGMARVIANMSDDLPQVDVFAGEFTSAVKSIGASYQWSIQDIRRAAMAGSDFMLRKARAGRLAIDRKHDSAAFGGLTEAGTTGFANNAAVPVVVLPTAGSWATIDADLVLANMHYLARSIPLATGSIERPDTMLLAPEEYEIVATRSLSPINGSPDTILSVFLRTNPYVRNVDVWPLLTGAGAGGVNRMVCYERSDRVLVYNAPVLFEQLAPQPMNLGFKVPLHGRVGVTEIHYPLAMAYADRLDP